MPTLAKFVYDLCSDEASAPNDYDLHFAIHVRLLFQGLLAQRYSHRWFQHRKNISGWIFEPGDRRTVTTHDPLLVGLDLRTVVLLETDAAFAPAERKNFAGRLTRLALPPRCNRSGGPG